VPLSAQPYPSPVSGGRSRVSSTSAYVTVTADATAHTPGAWAELIASNAEDTDWLVVAIYNMRVSGTDTRGLVNIATGAGGSEAAIVSSLPAGYTSEVSDRPLLYVLPLRVAKGARVSAQLQALITVDACGVAAWTLTAPQPGRRSPSSLVAIGADTAASTSTVFMTSSDTYVEIEDATTQPFQGLIACPCGGALSGGWTSDATEVLTLAVGASGAEVAKAASAPMTWGATELIVPPVGYVNPPNGLCATYVGHVPAGTRIATKYTTGRAYKGVIVFGIPYA